MYFKWDLLTFKFLFGRRKHVTIIRIKKSDLLK